MSKEETIKKEAQNIERAMGLRDFGDCPICDDMIVVENGLKKCFYCDWNNTWTPERTCTTYNNYWAKGQVKPGYEREPKTVEDFSPLNKKE